jgi:hypothetical protein
MIDDSSLAVEYLGNYIKLSTSINRKDEKQTMGFQTSLAKLERLFRETISDIKLKVNKILFIDGIDIRPDTISYESYIEIIRSLSNAVWELNTDFFANLKDTTGKIKIVLLLRPDIFNSLKLHNATNKLHDNSVFLTWLTDYESYRTSQLFILADKLFSSQQESQGEIGETWNYYNNWSKKTTNPSKRTKDDAFICLLKNTYYRPRDLIMAFRIMQEYHRDTARIDKFVESDFFSNNPLNEYSDYLLGTIKDQLAFYYTTFDYNEFLMFFT